MDDVVIPLKAGGYLTVIRADRERHGQDYLLIEDAKEPDRDGVVTLDEGARRALIAALEPEVGR